MPRVPGRSRHPHPALDTVPWCRVYPAPVVTAFSPSPPPHGASAPLRTTELCRVAGVTRGQLRIYERDGLLEMPPRSASGYRGWPADTPGRLLAIRHLKEVGFTLREIAMLLAERDLGRMSAARLQGMAREQLAAIDARIARLQVVRDYVAAVAQGRRDVLDDPDCRFLTRFLLADAAPAAAESQRPASTSRRPARERA